MTDRNEINGSTLTDETSSAGREAAQSVSAPEGNDCGGRKKGGKRGRFAAWLRRSRKKILISLTAILSAGAVLAVVLVPVHFATLNEPADFLSIPVVHLPLDTAVTVEKTGSYIAHPDTVWVDDGTAQGKIIVMYPLGHGKGELAMRVSSDLGATWSDRVGGLPSSFEDSQETPTLYNLHFTDGSEKLVMISGCPYWPATSYKANGFNFSFSDDGGVTWSEFENFHSPADAIVAMSSLTQLKENGEYIDKWMGLFHDHSFNVYKTYLTFDADGNAEWSAPELLMPNYANETRQYGMCEVEIIRNPDTDTLILISRAEKRVTRSLIAFSDDEGDSWYGLKELPYELSGDRHKAEYDATTGKVLISFRQMIPVKRSAVSAYNRISGGWYAWVGTFADLMSYANDDASDDSKGEYLIELGKTDYFAKPYKAVIDNGYSGVVCVNGTFNVVGYGSFDPAGVTRYIISRTFTLADIEAML